MDFKVIEEFKPNEEIIELIKMVEEFILNKYLNK